MIRVATAACVAIASLLACGAAHAEASNAEAAVRFERGKRLYKEGDFKVALIEFTRAYDVSPSYHVLFNIAQVHLQLGNYARAIVTLERYLHDGGDGLSAERRQQVAQDLELARTRTASLTIEANVP